MTLLLSPEPDLLARILPELGKGGAARVVGELVDEDLAEIDLVVHDQDLFVLGQHRSSGSFRLGAIIAWSEGHVRRCRLGM